MRSTQSCLDCLTNRVNWSEGKGVATTAEEEEEEIINGGVNFTFAMASFSWRATKSLSVRSCQHGFGVSPTLPLHSIPSLGWGRSSIHLHFITELGF